MPFFFFFFCWKLPICGIKHFHQANILSHINIHKLIPYKYLTWNFFGNNERKKNIFFKLHIYAQITKFYILYKYGYCLIKQHRRFFYIRIWSFYFFYYFYFIKHAPKAPFIHMFFCLIFILWKFLRKKTSLESAHFFWKENLLLHNYFFFK